MSEETALPCNRLRNIRRRAERSAGNSIETIVTCPASRHVEMMAATLAAGQEYPMFTEDPKHCAATLYSVLESLWKARQTQARKEKPGVG